MKPKLLIALILISTASYSQTITIANLQQDIITGTKPVYTDVRANYKSDYRVLVWTVPLIKSYQYSDEVFDELGYDREQSDYSNGVTYRNCSKGVLVDVRKYENGLSITMQWMSSSTRKQNKYFMFCASTKETPTNKQQVHLIKGIKASPPVVSAGNENTSSQVITPPVIRKDVIDTIPAPSNYKKTNSSEGDESKNSQASSNSDDNLIFTMVQQEPAFPVDLSKYVEEHIQYPKAEKEANITGKVYLTFVVEKDGSITSIKVLRGIDTALNNEAIRIISTMPKWIPGNQNGNPVRVQFSVPVIFQLK